MKITVYEKKGTKFEFDDAEHKYFVNDVEYPANTHILRAAGIGNYDKIPWEVLEHARLRGKAVHKAVELYEEGTLDMNSIHDEVRPYFECYLRYDELLGEEQKPILRECSLFCKEWGFATTIDQVRKIRGKYSIVELKTGRNSLSFAEIQTAGQLMALREQIMFGMVDGFDEKNWKDWMDIPRYALELDPSLSMGFKFNGPFTETAWHTSIFKASAVIYRHKKQKGELRYE